MYVNYTYLAEDNLPWDACFKNEAMVMAQSSDSHFDEERIEEVGIETFAAEKETL